MARVLLVILLAVYPMIYLGMYAGDAEIHLVYGANAADGGVFEFNRGEVSPGVTSPGFMLMIAALFQYLPEHVVPVAVKAITVLGWYGLSLMVFLLARRIGLAGAWAWVAVGVAGVIPGSAYNATIGMENGLFALVVLTWLYVAIGTGWFDLASARPGLRMLWQDAAQGGLLGVAVWLRPEGVVIGILALVHHVFRSARARSPWSWIAMRSLAFLIPFVLVTGSVVAFHYAYTGHLLPASGRARMLSGSVDALWVGPIAFNRQVLVRLLAYFPLTLMWLVGIRTVMKRDALTQPASSAGEFLVLIAGTFFVLYSTVLGAAHLARYLIFVMPLFVLTATLGAQRVWLKRGSLSSGIGRLSGRTAILVLAAALGLVFALETRERFERGLRGEVVRAMQAPASRRAFSDAMLEEMGAPAERPVVVAYREVQRRYWLDDRFVVRALDGRTDPMTLAFATRGGFDHVGYIKARGIRFLAELPRRGSTRGEWSLAELDTLAPSASLTRDGLVFTRLAGSEVIRIDPVR